MGTWRMPQETREDYFKRTARAARLLMTQNDLKPWPDVAERLRWNWLRHLARGSLWPTMMLWEMNALPVRTLISDIKRKFREDWIDHTQCRFMWRDYFETYIDAATVPERGFTSSVRRRAQTQQIDAERQQDECTIV